MEVNPPMFSAPSAKLSDSRLGMMVSGIEKG